jgi:hypothetical protein
MKKNALEYIIRTSLKEILREQAEQTASAIETDNAPSSAKDSPFTPAEERFLGKFDAYGSTHLGIVYSPSISGIREFIARSGKDLNATPGILLSLLRKKIIKLVPYSGFGRNTDYTIELQLSLDDVKGLGDADKATAKKGSSAPAAGGMDMGTPPETPAPENAGYIPTGNVIKESLLTESVSDNDIKNARAFWDDIIDGLKGFDWDEKQIWNAFNKYVKNRQSAIIIDALGRLIYDFDNGDPQVTAAFKKSKYYVSKMPEVPKEGYTITRLLQNNSFAAHFVTENYKDEMIKLLRFRGIGSYKIIDNVPVQYFPTYTKNDVWMMRNQILEQLLKM